MKVTKVTAEVSIGYRVAEFETLKISAAAEAELEDDETLVSAQAKLQSQLRRSVRETMKKGGLKGAARFGLVDTDK